MYSEYMNIIAPKANKITTVGENVKPSLLVAWIEELIPKKVLTNVKTTPTTLEMAHKM